MKKKDNIVVFGLDEPDAETAEERKDQDAQALQEVLETIDAAAGTTNSILIRKKGGKPGTHGTHTFRPHSQFAPLFSETFRPPTDT